MRAVQVPSFGDPSVLHVTDIPTPEPAAGQLRIRIHAAGVNPYDTYMRAGAYAKKPPLPYSPGADGAGVVDKLGDGVERWHAGDRVYIGGTVADRAWGAAAEYVLCTPDQVHPLPDDVSFAQGAGVNVPYVTAWHALFNLAKAQPKESLLIHGASGGVGVALTQMARDAGLTVIGTAGSEGGLELVRAEGAHHVLNHREPGYLEQLPTLTDGRGPDIVIEMLANVNLDHDLGVVAPRGRVVIIGSRGRVEIDPRKIMARALTVTGMVLWNLEPSDVAAIYPALDAGLASGALKPTVSEEVPFAEAARAHTMVMEGTRRGKIVLVP